MKMVNRTALLLVLLTCSFGTAFAHMGIDASEFRARRQAAMTAMADGIVLLHSFSAPKDWPQTGFQQDTNFYYFTGLENLHDAILAIDGTTKQTWLFVKEPTPGQQRTFAPLTGWDSVYLSESQQAGLDFGIDHVVKWDGFADFIEARRKANPNLPLYFDFGGQGKMVADTSNPPGLAPVENSYLLWPAAIKAKWPDATIVDASPTLKIIRAVKSPAEIALMKRAAEYTDAGYRAAIAAIAPGRTIREFEGAAVAGALRAGADGVSIWPEIKAGPLLPGTVVRKEYDYHNLNRTVHAGDTVTMDIGFSHEFYKGDVGRTFPASGHFSKDQREVVELMNGAYQAGLRAMRDGVTSDDVFRACNQYVQDRIKSLRSDLAKHAAERLATPNGWIMYTHGLDMVEIFPPPKELHSGNTIAFSADISADGVGFYQEDVLLITPNGYELINPPLPYSPADIEALMARLKRSKKTA
jgi:Xaa-Pro aminopeptidase